MKRKAQVYWASRLVPCFPHGELHCWVQENGRHISRNECTCTTASPEVCAIDAHRIPWVLENPDFNELNGAAA